VLTLVVVELGWSLSVVSLVGLAVGYVSSRSIVEGRR
jgi:hypothetical protein